MFYHLKEPASFIDENEKNETNAMTKYENSIFEKSVNEFDDFKLKCNARGKPKPKVIWFLRYLNGTQIRTSFIINFLEI